MKKILISTLIVIIIAAWLHVLKIIIGGLIIGGVFYPPIGYDKMKSIFDKDYELLVTVTSYFVNSGYENVYIPDTMADGETSIDGTYVEIEDVKIVETINTLMKKKKYSVIGKEGNTIYFQRWSNLDNGHGIAYSIDGNEPLLMFLTRLEPLPKPHWYYYETDFNEWKRPTGNSNAPAVTRALAPLPAF